MRQIGGTWDADTHAAKRSTTQARQRTQCTARFANMAQGTLALGTLLSMAGGGLEVQPALALDAAPQHHWGNAQVLEHSPGAGDEDFEAEEPRPRGKRGRGNGPSSQADYAMRHQAAEQRRRARINDRLDALRKLVPHDPRANTASFLEDVIKHILTLKDANEKLEQALLAGAGQASALAAIVQQPPAQSLQLNNNSNANNANNNSNVSSSSLVVAAQQARATAVTHQTVLRTAAAPSAQPAPSHGTSLVREAHSLQQLLSHAQQHQQQQQQQQQNQNSGMIRAVGGPSHGQAQTLTMTAHGGQGLQGVDVDIPGMQQVLLAPTGSSEQQELLLRSLMGTASGATALQLLSTGTGPNSTNSANLQHLLSAASQLAANGATGVQLTDEAGNVLHLG